MQDVEIFPVTPHAHGRLTARRGLGVDLCPHDILTPACGAWLDGWAAGTGIPPPGPAREAYLQSRYVVCITALQLIQNNAALPADMRDLARQALAGDSPGVRDG